VSSGRGEDVVEGGRVKDAIAPALELRAAGARHAAGDGRGQRAEAAGEQAQEELTLAVVLAFLKFLPAEELFEGEHGAFEPRAHERAQVANEGVAIQVRTDAFSMTDRDEQAEAAVLGGEQRTNVVCV
jgi:hypothetical protein